MSDRVQERTHLVSPDSFRQLLQTYRSFYNLHTDRNYGLSDSFGMQYAGTVENFGPEMIIESNKLRLKKPPIGALNISDVVNFYFDIQFVDDIFDNTDGFMYSGFVGYSTSLFYRQNMVCGLLKKDSLLTGYQYRILMSDVKTICYLSSESTSDKTVHRMWSFYTSTTPQLEITDPEGNVTTKDLSVNDGSGVGTTYYVPLNNMTYDLIDEDAIADIDNGNLVINISEHLHYHIPYFWFCVDRFRKMPNFVLTNNIDKYDMPLLYLGKDGNDNMHLYPSCGYPDAFPINSEPVEGCSCYLKAYGDFTYNDMDGRPNRYINGEVTRIEFLYGETPNCETPVERIKIQYSMDIFTVRLNTEIMWNIHTPQPGEYDYEYDFDKNKPYAFVNLSLFNMNHAPNTLDDLSDVITSDDVATLLHAFNVECDDRKFIDYYEKDMNHWVSGIHVDYTTDYSEYGVDKIRGVTRDLGRFDGLPRYFNEWLSRETHRAHIETYSIRDSILNNSNPFNRQTSALILDSGVPKNDMDNMMDDLNLCIQYQEDGVFDTVDESVSSTNYLSDLGYYDNDTFAYVGISKYKTLMKFIYHGSGVFSLGVMAFDPELEYARVYSVTNDPNSYVNNSKVEEPVADRTAARICDIPQSYVQLTNIPNKSPTFALDQTYVRQQASWTTTDEDFVWNERQSKFVSYNNKFIFSNETDLDTILTAAYLEENYSEYGNFGRTIDMSHPGPGEVVEFLPFSEIDPDNPNLNRGHDYQVGDEFITLIGGNAFRGTVSAVSGNGSVTQLTMSENNNTAVNIDNISDVETYWKTTTVTGDGDGLVLVLDIDQTLWNSLQIKKIGLFENLYALKLDGVGSVWVWKWNGTNWVKYQQLTGEIIKHNFFDDDIPIASFKPIFRELKDVYLYNMFTPQFDHIDQSLGIQKEALPNSVDGSYNLNTDLTDVLQPFNIDETFYIPKNSNTANHDMVEYHMDNATNEWGKNFDRKLFPKCHQENTFFAFTPAAKISHLQLNNHANPYMYDPLLKTTSTYRTIMDGASFVTSTKNMAYEDIIDRSLMSDHKLLYNVYEYSYRNDLEVVDAYIANIKTKTRTELMDMIRDMDENADPILVDDTTNRYTDDQLMDYIIERQQFDRCGLKIVRNAGEIVSEGKQPIGGYIKLQEVHQPYIHLPSSVKVSANPTYVFKLNSMPPEGLDNFKMYDEYGNDISNYTLLIIDNKMYIYNRRWKLVKTKSEGV